MLEKRKKLISLKNLCATYTTNKSLTSLKLALDHGLIFKKLHRLIQFKQKMWLKPYTGKNTELRKTANNEFGKDFFKLMNKPVSGIMGNVGNQKNVKLVTNNYKRSYLTTKLS